MKLSIIIPVYKVEDVVERTLTSCINQKFFNEDIELIIVNDGTPDNSMDVVRKTIDGYQNVRIIEQENQGLSAARTTGFKSAKGDYIWYVDSDDYINIRAFEYILPKLDGCDIVAIGFEIHKNGSLFKTYLPKPVHSGKEFYGNYYPQGAVFYIYRKQFLLDNDLRFFNGIFHEDFEFIPRVLFLAKTVRSVDKPIYYYIIRENSITLSFKSKRAFDLLIVAKSLQQFKSDRISDHRSMIEFNNLIGLAINNALSIISHCDKSQQNKWIEQFHEGKYHTYSMCRCSVKKYKYEGYIFRIAFMISPIKIYKVLQLFNSRAR